MDVQGAAHLNDLLGHHRRDVYTALILIYCCSHIASGEQRSSALPRFGACATALCLFFALDW